MHALLDTQALLWWLADDPALTKSARIRIAETENTVLISAASAWEIATKVRLGKLSAGVDLSDDFSGQIAREASGSYRFPRHMQSVRAYFPARIKTRLTGC